MAPLRANLAACSVVAGSMSATCANTPASVADLQAVTGLCFVLFSFFLLWMRSEARAALRSGMTSALRDGRAPLGGKRFAILCKHLRRRSTHAACGREELRGVSPRTEHESDRCLEQWCNPSLHRGPRMEISQKAKTAEHLHS